MSSPYNHSSRWTEVNTSENKELQTGRSSKRSPSEEFDLFLHSLEKDINPPISKRVKQDYRETVEHNKLQFHSHIKNTIDNTLLIKCPIQEKLTNLSPSNSRRFEQDHREIAELNKLQQSSSQNKIPTNTVLKKHPIQDKLSELSPPISVRFKQGQREIVKHNQLHFPLHIKNPTQDTLLKKCPIREELSNLKPKGNTDKEKQVKHIDPIEARKSYNDKFPPTTSLRSKEGEMISSMSSISDSNPSKDVSDATESDKSLYDLALSYNINPSLLSIALENENCSTSCKDISDLQIENPQDNNEYDTMDELESDDDNVAKENFEDSDLSTEEIETLLDDGLVKSEPYTKRDNSNYYTEKGDVEEKVVLKERGKDHFEILPEGWIEVTHNSGMPIYLHKKTRVCSASRPYFLGPGSVRKHDIPVYAIPCLQYLKELEKEKMVKQEKKSGMHTVTKTPSENHENDLTDVKPSLSAIGSSTARNVASTERKSRFDRGSAPNVVPPKKLESFIETKSRPLDYMAVRDYCMKRFEFQTVTVRRFSKWSSRRKYEKLRRIKEKPSPADDEQLILIDVPNSTPNKDSVVLNPRGKSPLNIFQEFAQHKFRKSAKFEIKLFESYRTPFGALAGIGDTDYGFGLGRSKKAAKQDAAKAALKVLLPNLKMTSEKPKDEIQKDFEIFRDLHIEHPHVIEKSKIVGTPLPYQILLQCLGRNHSTIKTEITHKMRKLTPYLMKFGMTVGKHCVSVLCKNKKEGRHKAAQAVLQLLHPDINSWRSLLYMYCTNVQKYDKT